MARKHIGTILSGGMLIFCILLWGPDARAQVVNVQKQTFSISGSVGIGNVEIKGFPTAVFTDTSGYFSVEVEYNWRGSIRPIREGYEFTPSSRQIGPVTSNLQNIDFTGEIQTFVISGSVQMPDVELTGFPVSLVSDASGQYQVEVEYGWSGTVTPFKEGYEFEPTSQTYDAVSRPITTNYRAKIKEYEIHGTITVSGVPLAGVTLNGLPGNPQTDQNGRYSAKVRYDWQGGEVIPAKAGYEFDPPSIEYGPLTANVVDDYYATKLRFTVSGTAGTDNVMIRYPGGTAMTDPMGNFSIELDYGATGRIKPEKEGWQFNPPEITLNRLQGPKPGLTFEASEIMLTIRGSTQESGVLLDGLFDENGQPVVSGTNGYYEVRVPYGFSGNVIPKKEGFSFSPAAKQYNNLEQDMSSETYRAEQVMFTIAGNVGMPRVHLKGLPGRVMSDAAGLFEAEVPYGWEGTVTPELAGYEFTPPSISYPKVTDHYYSETFAAMEKMYTISGQVAAEDGPLEGATVMTSLNNLVSTDYDGRYELQVPHGWSGKLQVGMEGYEFPAGSSINVPTVTSDRRIDIQARVKQITIKGALKGPDGGPLAEVALRASNDGGSAVSDNRGRWSLQVPYGWTGEITMEKPGLTFSAPQPGNDLYFSDPVYEDVDFAEDTDTVVPPGPGSSMQDRSVQSSDIDSGAVQPNRPNAPGTMSGGVPNDVALSPEEIERLLGGESSTSEQTDSGTDTATGPKSDIERRLEELRQMLMDQNRPRGTSEPNREEAGEISEPVDRGPMVSGNTFEGQDLREVLSIISAEINFPIISDPEVVHYVYASYGDMPVEQALDIILAGTNYYWSKTPHYYLVSTMSLENPGFAAGSKTKRFRLNYITAETAAGMLSPNLRRFVQAEPDEGHNITITAAPKLMQRIESDLAKLDHKPRQVLLEARVVVMERGDLLNLGIEWTWPSVQAGLFASHFKGTVGNDNDSSGKPVWGVTMGYSTDNTFTNALTMNLNLLQANNQAQILANPSVLAQDGKLAEMRVITEEYYMLTPPGQAQAGIFTRSELETIESGTTLTITPYIGDNNDITMDIAVEVSDSIPSGRASQLPVVTRRTSRNTVTVKNNGTAAIAGLSENRRKIADRTTPGLSRLPLIGGFFDSTADDRANKEIAIFITATIVREPDGLNRPAMGGVRGGAGMPSQSPMNETTFGNRRGNDFRSDLSRALARRRQ